MAFVYILRCSDGSYYTGSTARYITDRVSEHQQGNGAIYTRKRLPVELVYFEQYATVDIAFNREKQIQGWSRAKKEALFNFDFDLLHELAQCRNSTHFENYDSEKDF